MLDELKKIQTIAHREDAGLGTVSIVEFARDLPFDVRRAYYIHGVRKGETRGFHVHRKLDQFLICVNGTIGIMLDDGKSKRECVLDAPSEGLLVLHGVWHTMTWLDEGGILLVLASTPYDEGDYIRDYDAFREGVRSGAFA